MAKHLARLHNVDSAHKPRENATLEHVPKHIQALAQETGAVAIAAAMHILRTAPREIWAYNPPNHAIEGAPLQALLQDPSDVPLAEDDAPRAACLRRRVAPGETRTAAGPMRADF
ncbi:hypothetical protein GGX14DRAFT_557023 [Mycena pura]|uniref:Uncharacterized protein n=1 Tax=Mycena pura TaxID=153505 RepID=A0AAD6YMS4_9AGAR|nr:hypothetical protein GGX14DRAFT_557023 [Mycena pura]